MELGVFKSLWERYAHYLPFLNLSEFENEPKEWNLNISIEKLNKIFETKSEQSIIDGIKLLLEGKGWRTHLVASVAILKLQPSNRLDLIDLFWNKLSQGTMVSPQILVVLSIVDKNFKLRGKEILSEYKTTNSELPATNGSKESLEISDIKAKAATEYLMNNSISPNDGHEGGRIAKNWSQKLFKLVEEGRIKIE